MTSGHARRRSRVVPIYLLTALALVVTAMYVFSNQSNATTADASGGAATKAVQAGDPPPEDFWGDVDDIPPAENALTVKIANQTNGQYPDDEVYWSFEGETHSIAEQPYIDLPAIEAGRIDIHVGSPDSEYTDFVEFTVKDGIFYGNLTRVDGYVLPLAMRLHSEDGENQQVGEDYELFKQSREDTFQQFSDAVPEEFKGLVDGDKKIEAPRSGADFAPGGQHENYFDEYAQSVGVDAATQEIFACSGPLSEDPSGCAGLNRHVADLPEDQQADPENFYKEAPANYYAQFWHDHSIDNRSYGFPYDDAEGQDTLITSDNPEYLVVAVGY
ncbi:glycoside hydrolase family 64 protein [Streptomyces xiaopingdaonensis]|uniref:glycoside hydrolase family 64 protein n=1 Tax=Streptomyces xiaopingdaonensis TaxID=1565415 RepID=UPI00031CFB1F|nr:glycoside hydrolase family 64 protein [Streptomyces xiaopingdaonensis]